MARAVFTATSAWQQIASGTAVISIEKKGRGTLYFNEIADDVTAYKSNPNAEDQFSQTKELASFIRADATAVGPDAWIVLVDGTL